MSLQLAWGEAEEDSRGDSRANSRLPIVLRRSSKREDKYCAIERI